MHVDIAYITWQWKQFAGNQEVLICSDYKVHKTVFLCAKYTG